MNKSRVFTELNGCTPLKINVLGPYTFSIGDTSIFGEYQTGGIVTQVKKSKTISLKSLEESEKEPEFLACCIQALHKYRETCGGQFPRPWTQEDAEKFLQLCKSMDETVSDSLILTFAKICSGNTCPMHAVMGGLVGQEDLKACSVKFTPIYQWFYCDAIEYLPENVIEETDAQPLGSRYYAQFAIFGRKFQEKLGDVKYFIVGAGAISWELIKNYAIIGAVIRNAQALITDLIEKSNLNRQFLFRPRDEQKLKAQTAVGSIKVMNPN